MTFINYKLSRALLNVFSLYKLILRYPNQKSSAVNLKKGKMYYVMGLHKQLYGNHHYSVGVQLPSGQKLLPMTSSYVWTKGMLYLALVLADTK